MDNKELLMFDHYKKIIENRTFNEYDILAFLILIRGHIQKYDKLLDFAHLVAHRERNRGNAMECIIGAIDNNYQVVQGTKRIQGYHGFLIEDISKELEGLFREYNISYSNKTLLEIEVCLFTLSQFSIYKNKEYEGVIYLSLGSDNTLSLCTTEGKTDSLFICYSLISNINNIGYPNGEMLNCPVESIRIGGELCIVENGIVIAKV